MANLQHVKGTRTKVLSSFPTNNFGKEGDIVLSSIRGKGIYLCVKGGGRWHVGNKFQELNRIEKTSIKYLSSDRFKVGNTTITKDEYDVGEGNFTLDVVGDIELNTDGGQVTIKDGIASHFLFDCDSTQFTIYDDTDAADFFRITVAASGVTTIATVDDGAAIGHLLLKPDGDLALDPVSQKTIISATDGLYFDGGTETYITESSADVLDIYVGGDKILSLDESVGTGVTSLIGTFQIAEQADANTNTAGYGQLWVDTATPNELAFTDDAGTDIIGVGKYHYESKVCNYSASAAGNFIPLAGYVIERTSTAGQNEYIAMVAPYNGTIEKILWRSEADQDGTLEMDIYESVDATEVPGSVSGTKDTVLDRVDDDITQDVSFASMTSGTNALQKGRIYAIKITSPAIPVDTNVTVVFKWDITS